MLFGTCIDMLVRKNVRGVFRFKLKIDQKALMRWLGWVKLEITLKGGFGLFLIKS